MKTNPDMRHVRIDIGARVTLLHDQRRWIDSGFTELETIDAGTEGTVTGCTNAGFRGLEYRVRLDDGRMLYGIGAARLVAFA